MRVDSQASNALALLDSDDEDERNSALAALENELLTARQDCLEQFLNKSDAYLHVINEARATAEWRRQESKRLKELADRIDQRADRLLHNLVTVLDKVIPGVTNLTLPAHELVSRRSVSTEIDDEELIPEAFVTVTQRTERKTDKAAIKRAIQSGTDVPGAHLETKRNWTIK